MSGQAGSTHLNIRAARLEDAGLVLQFIRELAQYEKLEHEVEATEELLGQTLFGEKPGAEALLAFVKSDAAGFALFFQNYSTFKGRPGLYLEDLFVRPEHRGKGIGKAMIRHVARLAVERNCARFEWSVLDWNEPAIRFYKSLGAVPLDDWTIFRVTGDNLARLGRATD